MRKIIIIFFVTTFTGTASALSCAQTPDIITMHCTDKNPCKGSVDKNSSEKLNYRLESNQIPKPNKSTRINETIGERQVTRIIFQTKKNMELPSAKQALSEAKALCSSGPSIHLYPESLEKHILKDTTDCYTTRIEKLDDYYLVWREGKTESWRCVEKVRGQMVSGGTTHYVAPIGVEGLIKKIADIAFLFITN